MRLPDLVQKIKDYGTNTGDLPKDVFVAAIIVLVGLGAFLLGRISTAESERKAELRLLEQYSTGVESGGEEVGGRATEAYGGITPVATSSGKTSGGGSEVRQKADDGAGETGATLAVPSVRGTYVASKKGEVYYLPWCGGVKLIKEENKIWFASKEEAESQGYRPAANCKGI